MLPFTMLIHVVCEAERLESSTRLDCIAEIVTEEAMLENP